MCLTSLLLEEARFIKIRIGCLQFAPQLGDVNNNLTRADAVLARANPEDLDLLVLPELAFSGYNFRSLQQISPFLEPSGSGITSLWARTIALKYDCVVVAGYPEKVDVSPNWPTSPEYYNSAIVVNGDGETIANYRKSFLYYTDETWALEGNRGFYDGYIPSLGNTSIGICMDINPYKFEAPWHAFEFAFHVLEVESNLVIVTMSWITREDPRRFSRTPGLPDMDALTYWVTRLEPLIRSDNEEEIVVVFCNRAGVEDEAIYAGTSAVIGIKNGEVSVYGLLGRGERELLVVDTSNPPFAKLVYRPEANGMGNKTGELEQSKPDSTSSNPTLGRDSKLPDEALQEFDNTRNKDHDTSGDEASDEGGLPGDDEPLSSTLAPTKDKLSLPSRPSPPLSSSPSSSSSPPLPPPHPEPRSNSRGALSFEQDPLPHPPPSEKSPLSVETEPEVEATIKKPTNNKRHAPSISIPPPPDSAPHSGSVQSPATESINSPAPSAPRATPTAIRPRLIIPQSPSILPSQFTAVSDHPMSAASTKSERSVQSIRSNESEASVQTIRSNPRPPEDSTPYPHSGLPLSGYPSNSFQLGHEKRIYGGHVQIAHTIDGTITPTTPFDDISPAASRWFWRQPGSATFRTPASAGGWTPSTAIGRRPEPFPWPAIRSDVRLPSMTRAGNNERGVRHNTTLQEDRQDSSQTPQSNTSSNRTQWSKSSVGTPKPGSQDDKHPSKPSSPKSRNASRSGIAGFSDSSLSEADMTAVVSQHLEQIFQRAESMGRIPADSNSNDTPVPDRPSSPKSRNCSRSRRDEASDTQYGQQRPPVAPSPSLLERESRAAIIPTPVALDFYRRPLSRGATTLSYYGLSHRDASQQYANHDYDTVVPPWSTSTVRRDAPGSSLRSVSRGRQPKVGDDPSSQRPTSADSTRNQLLHTRVSKRLSREMKAQDADRQSRDKGSQSERRPSRSAQGQMEFERVEVISCPNCPVHGRQSVSSGGSNRGSRPTCGQSSSPLPNAPVLEADASQPEKTVTVTTTTTGSLGETGAVNGRAINDSSPPRKTDSAASRPERKTMFKSTFNPVTPKAMTFRHSDMDTEPIPNLECVEKKSSSGRRGNKEERVQTVELATSSTTAIKQRGK